MNFPLWRYGAYAVATAVTVVLATMNAASAWTLDAGVYRYLMITVSLLADVGAPVALVATTYYFRHSDPFAATASLIVLAACSYGEIAGAEVWLKSNSFVISAPAQRASEAQKAAASELEAETTNLTEIRKLLASERREIKLDSLRQREKAALERMERLRPQTFAANVEPPRLQFVGNERALAFALWLLSQAAWVMAMGRVHSAGERAPMGKGEPVTLTVRPTVVEKPQPVATSVNQWQPDDGPDDPGDPQPNGGIGRPTGCDRPQPTSTKSRTPLKLVERHPALDEFQTKVRDLANAGFSEREIQKRTGATRHQVRQAKAAMKGQNTTKGRS
jgi:hypothetical protein